jgi:hypothetical protein
MDEETERERQLKRLVCGLILMERITAEEKKELISKTEKLLAEPSNASLTKEVQEGVAKLSGRLKENGMGEYAALMETIILVAFPSDSDAIPS